MKLLLDMGLSPRTAEFLRQRGFDVDHLGKRGLPKLADEEIMRLAASEGRAVVTFDLDFSRLLAIQRLVQPSVILFRLEKFMTDGVNALLLSIIEKYSAEIATGVIIVVDPLRIRLRTLPIW